MLTSNPGEENEQVDMWLFLPPALGIAPAEYSPTQFYSDLRTYTRLKTPFFNIDDLLSSSDSPLVLLERRIGQSPSVLVQRLTPRSNPRPRWFENADADGSGTIELQEVLKLAHCTFHGVKRHYPKTKPVYRYGVMPNYFEMSSTMKKCRKICLARREILQGNSLIDNSFNLLQTKKAVSVSLWDGEHVSTVLYLDTKVDVSSRWLRHLAFGLQVSWWYGHCLYKSMLYYAWVDLVKNVSTWLECLLVLDFSFKG